MAFLTPSLYQVPYTLCNTLKSKWVDIQQAAQRTELFSMNQCSIVVTWQPETATKKYQGEGLFIFFRACLEQREMGESISLGTFLSFPIIWFHNINLHIILSPSKFLKTGSKAKVNLQNPFNLLLCSLPISLS